MLKLFISISICAADLYHWWIFKWTPHEKNLLQLKSYCNILKCSVFVKYGSTVVQLDLYKVSTSNIKHNHIFCIHLFTSLTCCHLLVMFLVYVWQFGGILRHRVCVCVCVYVCFHNITTIILMRHFVFPSARGGCVYSLAAIMTVATRVCTHPSPAKPCAYPRQFLFTHCNLGIWCNMNQFGGKHFLYLDPMKKTLCHPYYAFIVCGMWHGFEIYFDCFL